MKLSKLLTLSIVAAFFLSCAAQPVGGNGCCKSENPAISQSPFPLESFVEIHTKVGEESAGIGSGAVIANTKDDAYILTAAHVCQSPESIIKSALLDVKLSAKVIDLDGEEYDAVVHDVHYDNDLCVMRAEGMNRPPMKIAPVYPKIGQKYYNMASPLGVAEKGGIPLFEGFFSGNITLRGKKFDFYSMPVQSGSSGSAVFNKDGEIVGMIIIKLHRMENLGISPKFVQIRNFVEEALKGIK